MNVDKFVSRGILKCFGGLEFIFVVGLVFYVFWFLGVRVVIKYGI